MKGISLFSSAGIAELLFNELDIEIVLANELLEKRAKFYKELQSLFTWIFYLFSLFARYLDS